jgi:hypothetical protein
MPNNDTFLKHTISEFLKLLNKPSLSKIKVIVVAPLLSFGAGSILCNFDIKTFSLSYNNNNGDQMQQLLFLLAVTLVVIYFDSSYYKQKIAYDSTALAYEYKQKILEYLDNNKNLTKEERIILYKKL